MSFPQGVTIVPAACILLADYNRWMNARLYDAAATLSDAQIHEDKGAFFGSLFGTLNHIAAADTIWLRRFAQQPAFEWMRQAFDAFPQPTSLTHQMAGSLAELRAYRDRMDELISTYAASVTQAQLASTLHYANTAGQAQARNLGALVMHLFNHQTHHRGQATTLLSQFGVDVGVTDLLAVIPREA
ncbi:MAG: DinB family protein [Pseudomonadota bacterium]